MIKGIAHACYTVRDLDAAVAFYCGKLGLKPAFDFIRDNGERFGVYIHRHLCLEVDDLAATVAEFRGRGVQITDAKLGGDNSWQAWITDPDGNRIELHQYTPESKQTPWVK